MSPLDIQRSNRRQISGVYKNRFSKKPSIPNRFSRLFYIKIVEVLSNWFRTTDILKSVLFKLVENRTGFKTGS